MTSPKDDSPRISLAAVIAFGAGIVAGLTAGLLFAPRSGKESRMRILNYMRECHAKIRQKLQRKRDMAMEGTSKLAATLNKVVHDSQEALKEMQEKVTRSNNKNGKKS